MHWVQCLKLWGITLGAGGAEGAWAWRANRITAGALSVLEVRVAGRNGVCDVLLGGVCGWAGRVWSGVWGLELWLAWEPESESEQGSGVLESESESGVLESESESESEPESGRLEDASAARPLALAASMSAYCGVGWSEVTCGGVDQAIKSRDEVSSAWGGVAVAGGVRSDA